MGTAPGSPEQAFAALLAADPGRPFVTYYDEAGGERSELSLRSLANWVAKTHFLLTDELGLGAADGAVVALPAHWISVPILLGCATAGLTVVAEPSDAEVAFVAPDTVDEADRVSDVYVIAPEQAAVGLGDRVPAGTADYVSAVRPQPDTWAGVRFGAGPDDLLVDGMGRPGGLTRAESVTWARSRAAELGVPDGARVLSSREWTSTADWLDTLLVPLVQGGSVVYVRGASEAVLARRADQERATVRL